jgi:hypothetical protein
MCLKHLYRVGNYNQEYGDKPAYLLPLDLLLRCVQRGVDNDQGPVPKKKLLLTQGDDNGASKGVVAEAPGLSKRNRKKW